MLSWTTIHGNGDVAANNGETVRHEPGADKALAVICLSSDEHNSWMAARAGGLPDQADAHLHPRPIPTWAAGSLISSHHKSAGINKN
jgi:hypothetical protein